VSPRFEPIRLPGDGLTLAADAIGDPAAPAILFFHGGGQSRRSWRVTARRVAEAGYRGITVDLRGHGESDWAADGDYLLDAFGRDVERLLDVFDRPVSLVGASRGGQAAMVAGSRRPDRVSLIMLADVAPLISNTGVDRIREFLFASLAGFASVDDAADALAVLLRQARVKDAAGLRKMMREDGGRLFWHWDPKTVSPAFLNPPSEGELIEQAAAGLRMPTILVRAEHSDVVTEESVRRFRDLTPELIVVEAAGVGHMFTGDQNDAFAETLLQFLARFAPIAS
jgi:pimeloyl-ACP methyl ester carboxylesterase